MVAGWVVDKGGIGEFLIHVANFAAMSEEKLLLPIEPAATRPVPS